MLEPKHIIMLKALDRRTRSLYEDVKEGKVVTIILESELIERFCPLAEDELEYYKQIESPNADEKAVIKKIRGYVCKS